MNTDNLEITKLNLLQKLMGVSDASLIEKIGDILDKEMVVGYTAGGKPLTKIAYDKRLREAEAQIRSGNYISQEDLERESEDR